MGNRIEIYTITKDGTLLNKYSLINMEETEKDQLISGFLIALNNFAREINFPQGVSLIRSGNLEARYYSGEFTFTVLIIDYNFPLGLQTEPILSGLSKELNTEFERLFKKQLKKGLKTNLYIPNDYTKFTNNINKIIDQFGEQTEELYQKLILIECVYAKIPQKWILPLFKKIATGKKILNDLDEIPKKYQKQIKKVINKVNTNNKPLWELFALELKNN